MKITLEELEGFLQEQFPQGAAYGSLRKLGDGWADTWLWMLTTGISGRVEPYPVR